ncbi:uncharacterized protein NPIL_554721, partial [Nephila pilipes]
DEDILNIKLQAALKAAAETDAALKGKGVLSSTMDNKSISEGVVELTVDEQMKRARAIENINASSFVQQDFKSTRVWGKSKYEAPTDTNRNGVDIDTSDLKLSIKVDDSWKNDPEKLVHPHLFENLEEKTEKWKEKLTLMRNSSVDVQ